MQESKFLKVCGILMIIGGAIGIVAGIISWAGVGLVVSMASMAGVAVPMGVLVVSFIIALIGAVVELIAGILGVKYAKDQQNVGKCVTWGVIIIALAVISNILVLIAYPASFSVLSLICGLVLPILYLIAAIQFKKA